MNNSNNNNKISNKKCAQFQGQDFAQYGLQREKFRRIDHVKHPVSIGNSRQIIRAMDSS